jgi:hypothetical protein
MAGAELWRDSPGLPRLDLVDAIHEPGSVALKVSSVGVARLNRALIGCKLFRIIYFVYDNGSCQG